MKKALVIGHISAACTYEYITEVLLRCPTEYQIDVLTNPDDSDIVKERIRVLEEQGCRFFYNYDLRLVSATDSISHLYRGIRKLLCHLRAKEYDLVHIHFVWICSFVAALRVKKDARLVVSYWGSDLFGASKATLFTMKPLLRRADAITVVTRYMRERFSTIFHGAFDDKVVVTDFGTKNAEFISNYMKTHTHEESKTKNSFPVDKLCVFCGYNGRRTQRHIAILRLLDTLPQTVKNRLCLVMHCAYGLDETYQQELTEAMAGCEIECRLMTEFMTGEDLASLRMCADIVLNLQPTDAFSGSMLECMEAGAVVVKGDWLIYPELEEHDAFLLSIPSMDDLPGQMQEIVGHFELYRQKAEQNRGLITMQFWDAVRPAWMRALGEA